MEPAPLTPQQRAARARWAGHVPKGADQRREERRRYMRRYYWNVATAGARRYRSKQGGGFRLRRLSPVDLHTIACATMGAWTRRASGVAG